MFCSIFSILCYVFFRVDFSILVVLIIFCRYVKFFFDKFGGFVGLFIFKEEVNFKVLVVIFFEFFCVLGVFMKDCIVDIVGGGIVYLLRMFNRVFWGVLSFNRLYVIVKF